MNERLAWIGIGIGLIIFFVLSVSMVLALILGTIQLSILGIVLIDDLVKAVRKRKSIKQGTYRVDPRWLR